MLNGYTQLVATAIRQLRLQNKLPKVLLDSTVPKNVTYPSLPKATLHSKVTFFKIKLQIHKIYFYTVLICHRETEMFSWSIGIRREAPTGSTWDYNLAQSDTGNWPEAGVQEPLAGYKWIHKRRRNPTPGKDQR